MDLSQPSPCPLPQMSKNKEGGMFPSFREGPCWEGRVSPEVPLPVTHREFSLGIFIHQWPISLLTGAADTGQKVGAGTRTPLFSQAPVPDATVGWVMGRALNNMRSFLEVMLFSFYLTTMSYQVTKLFIMVFQACNISTPVGSPVSTVTLPFPSLYYGGSFYISF